MKKNTRLYQLKREEDAQRERKNDHVVRSCDVIT